MPSWETTCIPPAHLVAMEVTHRLWCAHINIALKDTSMRVCSFWDACHHLCIDAHVITTLLCHALTLKCECKCCYSHGLITIAHHTQNRYVLFQNGPLPTLVTCVQFVMSLTAITIQRDCAWLSWGFRVLSCTRMSGYSDTQSPSTSSCDVHTVHDLCALYTVHLWS